MIVNRKFLKLKGIDCSKVIYQDREITIYEELNGDYAFEIGKNYTLDAFEAVAILMRNAKWSKAECWNFKIEKPHNFNTISILYWLSGGDDFWKNPELNLSWVETYPILLEKFENTIIESFKYNKLEDIRKYFEKHLNLDIFYEFALNKGII